MAALRELDSIIIPDEVDTGWHRAAEDRPRPRDTSAFDVIDLDDIQIGTEPAWLIDGLMPATGLGVVYGLPKSGKSFIIADGVFHVAMGREWAGRGVLHGSVAYVAGEGVSGFKRRMVAFRRHHGVEGTGVPFGLISTAPNLGQDSGDDQIIVDKIRAWHSSRERPPMRAIVIDTLTRSMRGADENTAKDMGVFVDNCARIGAAFDCIVIVVHHAGKDIERGSRGSVALPAAADAMWAVEKGEGESTVSIVAMKDGEDGLTWQFRLQQYEFDEGAEEGGRNNGATTSCTVEILSRPGDAQPAQQSRSKRPLPDAPRLLLEIARDAIGEAGEHVSGRSTVPHDCKAITREMLKKYLVTRGWWDTGRPDNSNRALYSTNLRTLRARGHIGLAEDHIWLLD